MNQKLVWPDYKNCIANLPNSILRKFGVTPVGDTLPLLDRYLDKDYRNIVVILLDGMGKAILERHLKENGAFRSHLAGIYQSVFLSTTVAATTSVMSGLQPCEHSWLGWECYYPQVDQNVTVFFSTVQGTDIQAADYNVPRTITPYVSILDRLNSAGIRATMLSPFTEPYPPDTEALCDAIRDLCRKPGKQYIYAYWNQPDGLLHRFGCASDPVHEALAEMEEVIRKLADELEDTLIVVTADHGHIDTNHVMLQEYPALLDCLVRLPSLEPRVLNLFVKDGKKAFFEKEFNRLFGDQFLLLPMEEVLERKLLGTGNPHKQFRGMLGDYLALALSNMTIYFKNEPPEHRWVSTHGSVTADEMLIPLIVFDCGSRQT